MNASNFNRSDIYTYITYIQVTHWINELFFPFKGKLPTKLINPTFENYLLNFKSNLTVNIHHFYLNYSLYQQVVSFHFKTQSWIILAYKKEMFILIFLTTVSQKQKFYLKETFFSFFCFERIHSSLFGILWKEILLLSKFLWELFWEVIPDP